MSPGATHRTEKHPDSLKESGGGRDNKKKSESRLRKARAGLGLRGDLCAAPKLCVGSRVGKTRCWAQVPHIWGGSLSGVPRYMQSWQVPAPGHPRRDSRVFPCTWRRRPLRTDCGRRTRAWLTPELSSSRTDPRALQQAQPSPASRQTRLPEPGPGQSSLEIHRAGGKLVLKLQSLLPWTGTNTPAQCTHSAPRLLVPADPTQPSTCFRGVPRARASQSHGPVPRSRRGFRFPGRSASCEPP